MSSDSTPLMIIHTLEFFASQNRKMRMNRNMRMKRKMWPFSGKNRSQRNRLALGFQSI